MNAKMEISMLYGTDFDYNDICDVEDVYLEVVLSDDLYFTVSKYFTDWYDGVRLSKRYDGGYTIGDICNNDRNIYKRYYHVDVWVGNDHHNSNPEGLAEDETRLIDILNSTIPRRWYRWQYNDPNAPL
jgi:hypothetical protein